MSSNKIIMLKSSDGESFEMKEAAARKLQIVAHMIEDDCVETDDGIPLSNVTGKILALVIEYCNKHVDDVAADSTDAAADSTDAAADSTDAADKAKKNLEDWDEEFMKKLDLDTHFQLTLAANYLNVKSLLGLACQTIADHIKEMTVEEIRTIFNVENDYTDEEEEAVRKENEWSFH